MTDQESGRPEQYDENFAEGQKDLPHPDIVEREEEGRFSEGQEEFPDSPEKHVRERFSEGQEILPDSPEKHKEGRFSEGQEVLDPRHD